MTLAQHDDMIEALSSNRADHPFDERILPRRAWRGSNLLDAHSFNPTMEQTTVNRVAGP